jgi:hypothetical protein
MKTRKLELDSLSVESFATTTETDEARGTVEAREAAPACTCNNSCLCPTAYYNCGTGPFSIYSCDYTANRSCAYGAE